MADSGRGDTLARAFEACVTGQTDGLSEFFTDDVSGWSPNMMVGSLDQLTKVVASRDDSLSDVAVAVQGVDAAGSKAFAEYVLTATHSGPWVVDEDVVIEPTGRELILAGTIAADFTDGKISAFRNYFDDAALLVQMLGD
jgi:ketosteroid isomerase-like protein